MTPFYRFAYTLCKIVFHVLWRYRATGTENIPLVGPLIVAGNLSIIPLTGITLPFVSYGGSSMLINFVAVGILLQLSATRVRRQLGTPAVAESVEPQPLAGVRP